MKLASIELIKNIEKHPNADLLDIASVLGYKAIVKKDSYKPGDKIVFIQPDTVLPDKPWAAFYKAKSNRTKAIKLRKIWSEGIIESLDVTGLSADLLEGTEVSEQLGITHYEPPLPQDLNAKGNLPHGLFKTDEERFNNLDKIPYGEVVDVTQKIDGSSETIFYKDGSEGICTRSLELKPECINKYTTAAKTYLLQEKLRGYCIANNVNLALRGELYGNNIQSFKHNPHASKPLGFALYSVLDLNTFQYTNKASPHYFVTLAEFLQIETVPILEKDVVLTPELIQKYSEGIDKINGQPFEGVVIKGKGFSFKVINKSYDSNK